MCSTAAGRPASSACSTRRRWRFQTFAATGSTSAPAILSANDRAALILMDYPHRRRLKIYAHIEARDLGADPELAAKLTPPDYRAKVERGLVIHLVAFDWNCPQHIVPRFSEAELAPALAPIRARLEALEEENKALRAKLAAKGDCRAASTDLILRAVRSMASRRMIQMAGTVPSSRTSFETRLRRSSRHEVRGESLSVTNFLSPCHNARVQLVMSSNPLMKEMTMTPRLNAFAAAPAPMKSWLDFSQGLKQLGLEASLMDLVVTRASQINGCAFCLDMHTSDARKRGETEQRLYLLDAWRDSPLYSDRERAALAWTEALTLLAETRAPDDVYEALKAQFSDEEQVKLTLLIVAINGWNRIQVGFRAVHPVDERRAA